MKKALTIAGFDPSSGAGVTKDLDVFFSMGIHGIAVPTCMVVQGPQGVTDIHPMPIPHFASMLAQAPGKGTVDGVKIGVVWDKPYAEEIYRFLTGNEGIPIVVDPVFAAKNDRRLNTNAGIKYLRDAIFPKCRVITPNIDEASAITGQEIGSVEEMKEAARLLKALGPGAVVVKGGHLKGTPVDVCYDGKEFLLREKARMDRTVHGTGCLFSSFMLARLVLGQGLKDAFHAAEDSMEKALAASYRIDEDGYFYTSLCKGRD